MAQSECLVIADDKASPAIVAKDLLAQAEHDPSAIPALICLSEAFAAKVRAAAATDAGYPPADAPQIPSCVEWLEPSAACVLDRVGF